jgi:hypothetical protein
MKNLILSLVSLWWFIRLEEVANPNYVPHEIVKKDKHLADTEASRKFVEKWQGIGIYKNINFILCKVTYFGYDRTGGLIILMGLPTTGQVITARLALGSVHDGIVTQARNIKTKCTGNPNVTFTTGQITALGVAINAYEDTHGSLREEAFTTLNDMLKNVFLAAISLAAIASPDTAISLIQSCGCVVQGVGGKSEQVFDGFPGVASGTIVLVGPAAGAHAFHEWWTSTDNINWIRIQGTTDANTLITGLTPGVLMYFRHQIIDSTGGTGMSYTIEKRAN